MHVTILRKYRFMYSLWWIMDNKNKERGICIMMISPQSYVFKFRDADYKTLIDARTRLIEDLIRFEQNEMDSDRSGNAWMKSPSPEVIYQVKLEYLAALCRFMQQKYNKDYVRGDKALSDER